jgi:lanosterol synthase
MQNAAGGSGTYERTRGSELLEILNPADIFDRIMVEYSYPECTIAVITSLYLFARHFPKYRSSDISSAIRSATSYIKGKQEPDRSWHGS